MHNNTYNIKQLVKNTKNAKKQENITYKSREKSQKKMDSEIAKIMKLTMTINKLL